MTEPDEALIWAIESWGADKARKLAMPEAEIEAGVARADALLPDHDGMDQVVVLHRAHAYRAGQAASAKIDSVVEAINAARLEGIRLGLEAAAREAEAGRRPSMDWCDHIAKDIRALDPETIAKEAAR